MYSTHSTAANQFVLLENMVEPLKKREQETDVQAIGRILIDHAQRGWEIVEACGDEVRMPVLIFRKLPSLLQGVQYLVEEIPHAKGENDIQAVNEKLWQRKDEQWLPICVLDSPITNPIAIFKKSRESLDDVQVKVIEVPVDLFEKIETSLVYELLDQQIRYNLGLQCIMHGGLNPVLILSSKESIQPYEYLVDHAKGGIFSNQAVKLADLIQTRASQGWQVCGAFEDTFFWPCVVFKRPSQLMPIMPNEGFSV